jgi:hypothetical protein
MDLLNKCYPALPDAKKIEAMLANLDSGEIGEAVKILDQEGPYKFAEYVGKIERTRMRGRQGEDR